MKISFFALLFLLSLPLQAQRAISGTFSPAKDYRWLIAYRLLPGTQVYTADTAIKGGNFSLKIPENAQSGVYRLVYAVPQDEFYFDVIYNGKEEIQLAFDAEIGVSFATSQENKLFNAYFKDINTIEGAIIKFYSEGKSDKVIFDDLIKKLTATQKSYEEKSKGTIASRFITANKPYISSGYESIEDYISHKKKSYFDGLDLGDQILQASGFLSEKLTNYVFTALPLQKMSETEKEKAIHENIITVDRHLKDISDMYKFEVFRQLWKQATTDNLNNTSDFIYNYYLKPLSGATNNQKAISEIELNNRLRIGAIAPEITWKEGGTTKKLSTLSGAENYILIFWSSTCSHCLKEIPPLHEELKNYPATKVIAVGIEDNETTWKPESAKFPNFHHVLALGRWESEYADLYDIHKTPTFYLLDRNKRIIAKPESDREIVEFLKK